MRSQIIPKSEKLAKKL